MAASFWERRPNRAACVTAKILSSRLALRNERLTLDRADFAMWMGGLWMWVLDVVGTKMLRLHWSSFKSRPSHGAVPPGQHINLGCSEYLIYASRAYGNELRWYPLPVFSKFSRDFKTGDAPTDITAIILSPSFEPVTLSVNTQLPSCCSAKALRMGNVQAQS